MLWQNAAITESMTQVRSVRTTRRFQENVDGRARILWRCFAKTRKPVFAAAAAPRPQLEARVMGFYGRRVEEHSARHKKSAASPAGRRFSVREVAGAFVDVVLRSSLLIPFSVRPSCRGVH